jgi:hypothetical protein
VLLVPQDCDTYWLDEQVEHVLPEQVPPEQVSPKVLELPSLQALPVSGVVLHVGW